MIEVRDLENGGATSQTIGQDARIFMRDQASLEIIKGALRDLGIKELQAQQGNVDTASAALAQSSSPLMLIVDISEVEDPIARLHQLANVCDPDVNVIAVGDRNDVVLYRDLKNIGITEYIVKPVVKDVVSRICRSAVNPELEQPKFRSGKLVLVLGVRGGVGATTVAAHTAWHLSESGRRVVLLDLDVDHGDASLLFDTLANTALSEAVEFPERVDKLFL